MASLHLYWRIEAVEYGRALRSFAVGGSGLTLPAKARVKKSLYGSVGRKKHLRRRPEISRRTGRGETSRKSCEDISDAQCSVTYPFTRAWRSRLRQRQLRSRVRAWPTTSSEHRARVSPTLMRRSSATKPTLALRNERTAEKRTTSFSRPCQNAGSVRASAGMERQYRVSYKSHALKTTWNPSIVLMSRVFALSGPSAEVKIRRRSSTCKPGV